MLDDSNQFTELLSAGNFAFTSNNDEYRPVLILSNVETLCLVKDSNGVEFCLPESELIPLVIIESSLNKLQLKYREYQEFKNDTLEYRD